MASGYFTGEPRIAHYREALLAKGGAEGRGALAGA